MPGGPTCEYVEQLIITWCKNRIENKLRRKWWNLYKLKFLKQYRENTKMGK